MKLKNKSKESDIYNNNDLSPKNSIKFKNTFGKTMNDNMNENNNIDETNPFKKAQSSSSKKNNENKNKQLKSIKKTWKRKRI